MSERSLYLIRVVDHGSMILLVGRDPMDDRLIHTACDHRPFAAFWQDWSEAGLPQPITYDDESQTLHFE
jgi:hypothetical protein